MNEIMVNHHTGMGNHTKGFLINKQQSLSINDEMHFYGLMKMSVFHYELLMSHRFRNPQARYTLFKYQFKSGIM